MVLWIAALSGATLSMLSVRLHRATGADQKLQSMLGRDLVVSQAKQQPRRLEARGNNFSLGQRQLFLGPTLGLGFRLRAGPQSSLRKGLRVET